MIIDKADAFIKIAKRLNNGEYERACKMNQNIERCIDKEHKEGLCLYSTVFVLNKEEIELFK